MAAKILSGFLLAAFIFLTKGAAVPPSGALPAASSAASAPLAPVNPLGANPAAAAAATAAAPVPPVGAPAAPANLGAGALAPPANLAAGPNQVPASGVANPNQAVAPNTIQQFQGFKPLGSFADLTDNISKVGVQGYALTRQPTNDFLNGITGFITAPIDGLLTPLGMNGMVTDLTSTGIAGVQNLFDTGATLGFKALQYGSNGMRSIGNLLTPLNRIPSTLGGATAGFSQGLFGLPRLFSGLGGNNNTPYGNSQPGNGYPPQGNFYPQQGYNNQQPGYNSQQPNYRFPIPF